jgi:hypothetical protein
MNSVTHTYRSNRAVPDFRRWRAALALAGMLACSLAAAVSRQRQNAPGSPR